METVKNGSKEEAAVVEPANIVARKLDILFALSGPGAHE